jgi:hypothetical protein
MIVEIGVNVFFTRSLQDDSRVSMMSVVLRQSIGVSSAFDRSFGLPVEVASKEDKTAEIIYSDCPPKHNRLLSAIDGRG